MSAANPSRDESDREASRKDANELERKITEILKFGLPVATVLLAVGAGMLQGPALAILVLAGGALFAVIAILWASVRTLFGETPLSGADAYALGAPRAEEEQKRAVLRALKDLEFERSVGKISDEDYAELVAKYRAEAKRLLRILDAEAQPRRDHIEALVNKRLRREGFDVPDREPSTDQGPPAPTAAAGAAEASESAAPARARKRSKARSAARSAADPAPAGEAADASSNEASAPDRKCGTCGTMNDADAVFCKKCGARRAPEGEASEAPAKASEAPAKASEAPAKASEAPAEASEAPAKASEAPAEAALPSKEEDAS
jgi:hypothetical protein